MLSCLKTFLIHRYINTVRRNTHLSLRFDQAIFYPASFTSRLDLGGVFRSRFPSSLTKACECNMSRIC